MQTDPPAGVSASPIADNVMTWYAPSTASLPMTPATASPSDISTPHPHHFASYGTIAFKAAAYTSSAL